MEDVWKRRRHADSIDRRRVHRLQVLRLRGAEATYLPSQPNESWVVAPEMFEVLQTKAHENLVDFLYELRRAFMVPKSVCIDFRRTTRMIAGGTLLFQSELRRLLALFPDRPVRCVPARDAVVNEVLQHLGIFSLLGYRSAVVPNRQDVVTWRTASGTTVNGEEVGELIESYESISPAVGLVFRGVAEAMLNSVQHAYLESRRDGLPSPAEGRWWLFCRISDNKLFVSFCDLGIGVPRSLPLKYPMELIELARASVSGGKRSSDALMIQAAMEIARTRTGIQGRGKGLADLRRVVNEVDGAELYLFSNRGLVKYADRTYKRTTYRRSILGTLVVWTIPLSDGQNG